MRWSESAWRRTASSVCKGQLHLCLRNPHNLFVAAVVKKGAQGQQDKGGLFSECDACGGHVEEERGRGHVQTIGGFLVQSKQFNPQLAQERIS